jgi:hypothetical protein
MTDDFDFTPEEREVLRRNARKGGLAWAAQYDAPAAAAHARAVKAAGWLFGHGCSVCGERINIPTDLETKERKRRADVLRKRHYSLLAMRRHGQ